MTCLFYMKLISVRKSKGFLRKEKVFENLVFGNIM